MKALRITSGIILAVIALNAFGGGYYGMAGAENVPVEWLEGSPFKSYFIPGLFLFLVIGGICTAASVAVLMNTSKAYILSIIAAFLLIAWIAIQVSVIGYVSWMQPAIFISAVVILVLSSILKRSGHLRSQRM